METRNDIYTEFGLLGMFFKFIDEHPRTSSVLLWVMAAALAYVVWTYNFTTRI